MKTDEEIRSRLRELADTARLSPDAWTRINERYAARPRRRWQSIRPVAALAASISVVVLGVGLSQRDTGTGPTSSGPSLRAGVDEVASGTTSGVPWSVTTYRDSSGRGCFELRSQAGARSGRCEAPEPSQNEITTISSHSLDSATSESYVMTALVAADAGPMTVTFLDGSVATVEVIPITLDDEAFGLAVLAAAKPIARMAAGATVLTCDRRSATAGATGGGCVRY